MEIKVLALGKDRFIKFDHYLAFFADEDRILQDVQEAFVDKLYEFTTDKQRPLVIDIGSGLAIAELFVKQEYPEAKIVCFEPNEADLQLGNKNIYANKVQDITWVNVDVGNNIPVLASYINHDIELLKFDQHEKMLEILQGLGKKILNIKYAVLKCKSKEQAEQVKAYLEQEHFAAGLQELALNNYVVKASRQ